MTPEDTKHVQHLPIEGTRPSPGTSIEPSVTGGEIQPELAGRQNEEKPSMVQFFTYWMSGNILSSRFRFASRLKTHYESVHKGVPEAGHGPLDHFEKRVHLGDAGRWGATSASHRIQPQQNWGMGELDSFAGTF